MDAGLREDLEIACMDAMRGDPPGPGLAARLQLAVVGVLTGRGLRGFRVEATSTRQGTSVSILFLRPGRRVEEVVLKIA